MIIEPNFEKLVIPSSFVSVFASGVSVNQLTREEVDFIKSKSFVITTNYPLDLKFNGFIPDLHIWSDEKTTEFMESYTRGKPKDYLWCSRGEAFNEKQRHYQTYFKVDFWFDRSHYKLTSNFTLFWIVQLLKQFFKDKTILIFGLDGYIPDNTPLYNGVPFSKWYDYYIKDDFVGRTFTKNESTLNQFVRDLEEQIKVDKHYYDNIINCNYDSRIKHMSKIRYNEVLK